MIFGDNAKDLYANVKNSGKISMHNTVLRGNQETITELTNYKTPFGIKI